MCDIEGDIEIRGLLVDSQVTVSKCGQVNSSDKDNQFDVKGVHSCVRCSVNDVLPMLGHSRSVLANYLLNANFLPYEKQQIKEFQELSPRVPGPVLVKEDDHLLGVVIDEYNEAYVLGVVATVLPSVDAQSNKQNVLLLKNGQVEVSNSKCLDLNLLISENKAKVGVISVNGFLLVQTNVNSDQLVLILQHGYLVIMDGDVIWTRQDIDDHLPSQGQVMMSCKQSPVNPGEIFVASAGVILPVGTGHSVMNLRGSHNAIVNYAAFKQCVACLDSATKASPSGLVQ